MSKNWGRTPVTNPDTRGKTQMRYLVELPEGTEERIDRRPMGKVERFVDPDGGVMSVQMYSDGDSRRAETEIRQRAQLHRKEFIEFAKCPVKHGTRQFAAKDFSKMPTNLAHECDQDPRVMQKKDGDLYAGESCPHIQWLIESRRKKAGDAYRKRNALAVAKEQAEEKRRKLDALDLAKRERELESQVSTERRGRAKLPEVTE